jgi:hypothetical protein
MSKTSKEIESEEAQQKKGIPLYADLREPEIKDLALLQDVQSVIAQTRYLLENRVDK